MLEFEIDVRVCSSKVVVWAKFTHCAIYIVIYIFLKDKNEIKYKNNNY